MRTTTTTDNEGGNMHIDKLLNENSVVGVVGNKSTGKTSLALCLLVELKKKYPQVTIAVMGAERQTRPYLKKCGIIILRSRMDILDLRLKNAVIYIAEFALFFNTRNKNKQLEKLMRFFDRIEHNNCKLIIDTAREGFFNKFMCSRVHAFLVKQIEYASLVNGTWLSERVQAIESTSDYRLDCEKSEYYIVTSEEGITLKQEFPYVAELDSKKNNKPLFVEETTKIKIKKENEKQ